MILMHFMGFLEPADKIEWTRPAYTLVMGGPFGHGEECGVPIPGENLAKGRRNSESDPIPEAFFRPAQRFRQPTFIPQEDSCVDALYCLG